MPKRLHPEFTFANVVACLALFVALGSGAYAATQLPKNSVGPRQLRKSAVNKKKIRKNAVSTAKIVNQAVTAAKVKDGTLTGKQINASTLATVPSAQSASEAAIADVASSLVPAEAWHEVGQQGEPQFQNGWATAQTKKPPQPETIAFYKDRGGVVHLKGIAGGGGPDSVIFQLPGAYRPASGRFVSPETGLVSVYGSDSQALGRDGAVISRDGALTSLDGITFRAES
jgi:hypothetical protein